MSNKIKIALAIAAASFSLSSHAAIQIEEVTVTAQKREQSLQEVPIAVSVMSEETLDRNQFSDLRAIAALNPSITFQEGFSPSATSFSIRGVGSYAFEGGIQPSVSFVVDGTPYARAGEFVADLADVAQIEVLRGPQGTLFGRNATGGAVNIVRNKPTDEFESYVEVGATDDEENMVRGMISGPLSDTVRGRLVGMYQDRDGHIENIGTGGNAGGQETLAFVGKLDVDLSDTVNLMLTGDYSDREHGFTPQVAEVIDVPARLSALGNGDAVLGQKVVDDPFLMNVNKTADENENLSWGLTAELNWTISDNLTFTSVSAYRDFEDLNNPDVDGTPANGDNLIMPIVNVSTTGPSPSSGLSTHSWQVYNEYFTQEFRLTGTEGNVDWIAGIFYQDYEEHILGEVPLLIIDGFIDPVTGGEAAGGTSTPNDEYFLQNGPLDNAYSTEAFAVFGDATWHVTDRLDIFAGVRYTEEDLELRLSNQMMFSPLTFAEVASRFDASANVLDVSDLPVFPAGPNTVGTTSTSESEVSARLGVAYDVTEDLNIYASVARGFVGPAADMGRMANVTQGFLAPTTALSYEIGMKSHWWDNRVRLDVALFSQTVEDLQMSASVTGSSNTRLLNAGEVSTDGLEVDFSVAATENLTLSGGFVYLDSEISEDVFQECFFGQTAAQGCNIDNSDDGTPDTQNIRGKTLPNTPDYKYNLAMQYDLPLADMPFDGYALLSYVYTDDLHYDVLQDVLQKQKGYDMLNLTLGFVDKEGRYEIQVFGKNILDDHYYADKGESFGALGRIHARTSRNAQAYWGARLKYNFN
jgi:iron complex outermembrane receptor protein